MFYNKKDMTRLTDGITDLSDSMDSLAISMDSEKHRSESVKSAVFFWKSVLDNCDKFEVKDIDINDDIVLNTAKKFYEFIKGEKDD